MKKSTVKSLKGIKITTAIAMMLLLFQSTFAAMTTQYMYSLNTKKSAQEPYPVEMVKVRNVGSVKNTITRGIVFSYKSRSAKSVFIAGSFSNWLPVKMTRNKHGLWYYYLEEYTETKDIVYKYKVDGIWIYDPLNPVRKHDGKASYISVVKPNASPESPQVSFKEIESGVIEFRIHNTRARIISLVGDFNNWNPESDLMVKERNGLWRITKKIPEGTYRYCYIVDGEWQPDIFNKSSGAGPTGDICSILRIK